MDKIWQANRLTTTQLREYVRVAVRVRQGAYETSGTGVAIQLVDGPTIPGWTVKSKVHTATLPFVRWYLSHMEASPVSKWTAWVGSTEHDAYCACVHGDVCDGAVSVVDGEGIFRKPGEPSKPYPTFMLPKLGLMVRALAPHRGVVEEMVQHDAEWRAGLQRAGVLR